MEFFDQLRIAVIPKPYKILVAIFLISLLLIDLYVAGDGLIYKSHEKWVEAGAILLGNILPISLIALLSGVSNSGISALHEQTTKILTIVIPRELENILDYSKRISEPIGPSSISSCELPAKPTINVIHNPGRGDAEYTLRLHTTNARKSDLHNPIALRFRIELNVRRVNLCLYFPTAAQSKADEIITSLKHSLGGAKLSASRELYAYTLNPSTGVHEFDGIQFHSLVFVAFLSDDFLYSPREQLYFSQDLMYFLKSIIKEADQFLRERSVDNNS